MCKQALKVMFLADFSVSVFHCDFANFYFIAQFVFSSLRKSRRSPPKPQNKSTPLKTRNQRMRRHDTSDSDDSDLSLTDEALYSTPIEAKIEVRRYVGKSAYVSTSDQDTSF